MPVLIIFLCLGAIFVVMGILSVYAVHCERRDLVQAEKESAKAHAAKV